MTKEEVLGKLKEIFKDVFDRDIDLTFETTAKDVQGWDSLTHITIISLVEETFSIKFKMKEVISMQNVGDMIDIILRDI